ncbi:hypothetical protein BGX38DRAFT_1147772 [Terfezia claveryi]|nr:hypothetical protein BGX38DRAFT_1147772 [Terfezia claveryi]
MGHFHQSPYKKNSRDPQETTWPPLSWEHAKDWKRQKVNRVLKAGIKEAEHAMITGRAIGTNKTSDKGPNVLEGWMLTIQEELAEGGADDCLSDEDIGMDIEEDYGADEKLQRVLPKKKKLN